MEGMRKSAIKIKMFDVFGKLTVVGEGFLNEKGVTIFPCKCGCGKTVNKRKDSLLYAGTKSCGCLQIEKASSNGDKHKTHGMSHLPIYGVWRSIKVRCFNKKCWAFKYYGGKGITVCKRWNNSFSRFVEDMGLPKLGETIDRIDNLGDYKPSNCRWASRIVQARNKSTNIIVELDGEKSTFVSLCEKYGIERSVVYNRYKRLGWDIKKSLTSPIQIEKRNRRSAARASNF